jgi:hypothetical protein
MATKTGSGEGKGFLWGFGEDGDEGKCLGNCRAKVWGSSVVVGGLRVPHI